MRPLVDGSHDIDADGAAERRQFAVRGPRAAAPRSSAVGHAIARDVRMLVIPRLAGFTATLPVFVEGLATDVHFRMLLAVGGVSLALLPVSVWASSRRQRQRAFDAGMLVDLLVLTLLLHLTGGRASPLVPLLLAWVILGIFAYRGVAALAYTAALAAIIPVQPVLDRVAHPHPPVGDADTAAYVTGLLVVAMAASLEVAARIQRRFRSRLASLASEDPLTGTGNRRAFEACLDALARDRRDRSVVIAVVDLDHFKDINDQHGHATGDRVLTAFAAKLTAATREEDGVYRIGGEEFAVVFATSDLEMGYAALRRVQDHLRIQGLGRHLPAVSFSAGVTTSDVDRPFEEADELLYEAKLSGRDRIVCGGAGCPAGV